METVERFHMHAVRCLLLQLLGGPTLAVCGVLHLPCPACSVAMPAGAGRQQQACKAAGGSSRWAVCAGITGLGTAAACRSRCASAALIHDGVCMRQSTNFSMLAAVAGGPLWTGFWSLHGVSRYLAVQHGLQKDVLHRHSCICSGAWSLRFSLGLHQRMLSPSGGITWGGQLCCMGLHVEHIPAGCRDSTRICVGAVIPAAGVVKSAAELLSINQLETSVRCLMVLGMLLPSSPAAQQQLAGDAAALQQLLKLLKQQEDLDAKIISRDLVRLLMHDDGLKGQIEAAIREAGSEGVAEQQQAEADQPQQQPAAS